ncbi:MutS-related protein [Desulfothermus okinawensis]
MFFSILHPRCSFQYNTSNEPDFFSDLHLHQVVETIIGNRQEYNLYPFFWTPLHDPDTIWFRQEVMRDLEDEALMGNIKAFCESMNTVYHCLEVADTLDFSYHKKGWVLEAVLIYCDALKTLTHQLSRSPMKSRGLLAFREYVESYVESREFQSLLFESHNIKESLSKLRYCIVVESGRFKVKPYEGESDYSPEIEKTFEKFRQGDEESYLVRFSERSGMSHIESKILEFVSKLYPGPFEDLDHFCEHYSNFLDATIRSFEREVQFYISYLELVTDLKIKGLPFCYPIVSATSKEVYVREGFDLALALESNGNKDSIVLNNFYLKDPERIIVVTGPNQGGKTTFARMFGQLHYLASLGCPVPAREARLFLFDNIFTHFQQEEDIRNLHGKLEDDLIRICDILSKITGNSIFILNEIFSSTTLQDALFLSKKIMDRLTNLDALGVWVAFLDELSSFNEKTISMVAIVDPKDPTTRTFKIMRKSPTGLAYALSLAKKHALTYEQIKERLSQ